MSGWLPPGCTDKDIDDAAPHNEPDDPRDDEGQCVEEDEATIRYAAARMMRWGVSGKAHLMDVIRDLIEEHSLEAFGNHRNFYHHYRGEAAE